MQTVNRVVVLAADGTGQPTDEEVLAALAPRFSVSTAGRSRTMRRTWLDTFDWRLHRAGLTLEHLTGPRPGELVLTGPGGEIITQRASRLTWPALAMALPAGPVRDRLRAVAGVRALLPAARAASAVQDMRVLNPDTKTIAWISRDRTAVSYPAATQLPARLQVTPVRGYQAQAERVAQVLAAAAGDGSPAVRPLDAALAAAGRRAEDYSNKIDVGLTPGMPARLAMRVVLLRLLDTLQANVPGTIRDIDTEFLHDLRVSVRRTRSALKLAGDVLPAGLPARFRGEFKWLGDLTTPTRDLDVYLLNYHDMAAGLVSASAAELEPFHEHLGRRRAVEQRQLARGLRSARFSRLAGDWRAALTDLAPPAGGRRAADVATDRISRAHRRVLRQGQAITGDSPAERLHDLRKRCKELRYLLEFFASLFDPVAHQRVVKDLKGLQDCLGEFQDRQVQQQEIREFAAQMMTDRDLPATALLAMGELAGQVGLCQQRAREEFAGRFREFASPASERRFRSLTSGVRR
ncbi:MAG TPA: CHAD domain-containing protein [Streptosporangiaceae bacterium]|nr:CHAD domain-containing protein [Streptosporangiaceae bacterium]